MEAILKASLAVFMCMLYIRTCYPDPQKYPNRIPPPNQRYRRDLEKKEELLLPEESRVTEEVTEHAGKVTVTDQELETTTVNLEEVTSHPDEVKASPEKVADQSQKVADNSGKVTDNNEEVTNQDIDNATDQSVLRVLEQLRDGLPSDPLQGAVKEFVVGTGLSKLIAYEQLQRLKRRAHDVISPGPKYADYL